MTKTTTVCAAVAGWLFLGTSNAMAQAAAPATEKYFLNVNIGGQLSDRSISTVIDQTIYEEAASLASTIPVSGSAIFDASAGYRVWGDVYVALAVTTYSDNELADYTAIIPHPVFFNRPATITGRTEDLKRREIGFHPQVVWVHPLTDRFDASVALGPSFIRLSQDVVNSFNVQPQTQNGTVGLGSEKGTAKGVNIGADVIYNVNARYGAGAFLRYAHAKVDLPSVPEAKAGGLQIGAGVRLRLF